MCAAVNVAGFAMYLVGLLSIGYTIASQTRGFEAGVAGRRLDFWSAFDGCCEVTQGRINMGVVLRALAGEIIGIQGIILVLSRNYP